MEGAMDDGMTEAGAGRAAVRDVLLAGLSGWDRPRKMDAGAFAAMQDRLADRLAYLPPDRLAGLLDLILRYGGTLAPPPARPRWPDQGVIEAWAAALYPRPASDHRGYVRSLLGSAMGRQARAEGWLVELYRHALRAGPPPQRYSLGLLRDRATDARRRREFMTERPDRAGTDDHRWWAAYEDDRMAAEALVGGVVA
jgi:hypothetical protein